MVGRLEIPRLGLEAIVREGDDEETLDRAVGLIPGTARPGDGGNTARSPATATRSSARSVASGSAT